VKAGNDVAGVGSLRAVFAVFLAAGIIKV
jgi:hypothetical protein